MENIDITPLNFRVFTKSIHQLIESIESDRTNMITINLERFIEKDEPTWSIGQCSRFIESILIRAPVMPIILNESLEYYTVIDGYNRLNALKMFFNNDFALSDLNFLKDLEGKAWQDLQRSYQRRIEETNIIVHSVQSIGDISLSLAIANNYI